VNANIPRDRKIGAKYLLKNLMIPHFTKKKLQELGGLYTESNGKKYIGFRDAPFYYIM